MDDDVIQSHIDLYVNEYTRDLGTKGHEAINKMRELVFDSSEDLGAIND